MQRWQEQQELHLEQRKILKGSVPLTLRAKSVPWLESWSDFTDEMVPHLSGGRTRRPSGQGKVNEKKKTDERMFDLVLLQADSPFLKGEHGWIPDFYHCRGAVVKNLTLKKVLTPEQQVRKQIFHTLFAGVTFTSGSWEGILSGHGGTYEHPSQYFGYQ